MRKGWKEVIIGDLGKVVTGNTPPKNDSDNYGGKYAFIKPTDMDIGRRHVINWEENYSEKAFKRYRNSYIPPKATGVVTIGTVGEKIFQADQWCFTNQSVNVIIPNTELYDEDFIFYLMKINLPKVENANPGTASGRHHVSKSNFCAIKVRVPENKAIQRKIASILSGYDDLMENNLKRIKILEETAQHYFKNILTEIKTGKSFYLNEIIDFHIGGGWGEDTFSNEFSNEAFVIRGTDINPMRNGSISNVPLRFHKPSNLKSRKLIDGDIIFEVSGGSSNEGVAKTALITNELLSSFSKDVICASFCKLLRVKEVKHSYYLFLFLQYLRETKTTEIYEKRSASNIVNYNWEAFLKYQKIILPNETQLELINSFVGNLFKSIHNLGSQNQRLAEARDILLPRLMMGIIDLESVNSEKEPAKVISLEKPKKEVSKEFKEAVLIAVLTERFGSEKYPLGRKRYTKLAYLFHRYSDNKIQDYLRKAAGPYNPKTKYGGPEKIALNSKYIQNWKSDNKMTGFVIAEKIEDAKNYFQYYWQVADLDWLTNEFKFKSNDELELLATVDNSLVELANKNMDLNTANVLAIIKSETEWEAKLERTVFNDANVEKAIGFLRGILEYGGQ